MSSQSVETAAENSLSHAKIPECKLGNDLCHFTQHSEAAASPERCVCPQKSYKVEPEFGNRLGKIRKKIREKLVKVPQQGVGAVSEPQEIKAVHLPPPMVCRSTSPRFLSHILTSRAILIIKTVTHGETNTSNAALKLIPCFNRSSEPKTFMHSGIAVPRCPVQGSDTN